ncbi:MAG: hypothetical protein ACKOPG_10400 [Novosphingobium sp.]
MRAIFGDPEMAQKQAQVRAEMDMRAAQAEEARAHGGLYTSQTTGQNTANAAQAGLPSLVADWVRSSQPVPQQTVDSQDFANFDQPLPQPEPRPDPGSSLAALIGAMGQMNGDKVDPRQIMGTLGAFAGGDELARRGLVAQGQSPSKDFAITPQRADEISARDAVEEQTKDFGVARINHASDIPVANIKASADRYGADQRLVGTEYTADTKGGSGGATRGMRNNNPGNLEYGPFARQLGATGSDGRFAVFPTFEAGVKAQERLLGGRTYYGGGLNTINAILNRYAPPGENPTGNYAAYVSRVTGIPSDQPLNRGDIPTVAAAMRQFESGGGTGAVNKNAPKGKGVGAAAVTKAPRMVSATITDKISTDIDTYFRENGNITLSPVSKNQITAQVIAEFQKNGNIPLSISTVVQARAKARNPARWAADTPPTPGARKARDGKWYVQTGKKPDGSPAYSRVDNW